MAEKAKDGKNTKPAKDTADPTNPTVATRLAMLETQTKEQTTELKQVKAQRDELKHHLDENNAALEAAIRADMYPKIKEYIPNKSSAELDAMSPRELHDLHVNLTQIAQASVRQVGKLNLIGDSVSNDSGKDMFDEVPNLFGKTREELVKRVR